MNVHSTRPYSLPIAIFILACLLFVVGYASRRAELTKLQLSALAWQQRMADAEAKQAALREQLNYVQREAYVYEVARNRLGMVQPGDELIIPVAPPSTPLLLPLPDSLGRQPVNLPVWRQWLELFQLSSAVEPVSRP
jgi:cell division protein FtsB